MSEKVQVKQITISYFEKLIGAKFETIRKYLCRSEFAHIKRISKDKHKAYFLNVTMNDIRRLQELCTNGLKRTGRIKNESK